MEKENLIWRHHTKAQALKHYISNVSKYIKNFKIKKYKIRKKTRKDKERQEKADKTHASETEDFSGE